MALKKLNLLMIGTALAISPSIVNAATLAETIGQFNTNGTPNQYEIQDGATVITTDLPSGYTPLEVGPNIERAGTQQNPSDFTIIGGTNQTGTVQGEVSVVGDESGVIVNGVVQNDLIPYLHVENIGKQTISSDAINTGSYTQIQDSDITGGWTKLQSASAADAKYAAIAVERGGLQIKNSVFKGSLNLSSPTVDNQLTSDERDSAYDGNNGGAISLQKNSVLGIDGSLFYKNASGTYGGAIDADDKTSKIEYIKNSYFITNSAQVHGGALDIHGIAGSIKDTVFYDNEAALGGAVYLHEGAYVANASASEQSDNGFYNVVFDKNTAGSGGAIYQMTGGDVATVIQNSTFKNNIAEAVENEVGKDGAGSAIRMGGILNTTNTTFEGNQVTQRTTGATALGGTVYVSENGKYTSTNDTFKGNTSVANAGAIYNAGTTTVTGTTSFDGNSATNNGGAIYNKGTLTLSGAGITFGKTTANSANLGNDIYNDTTGIVNIENAKDDIDLDDKANYSDQIDGLPTKATNPHTMFTDTGDIVNLGTMNITSSELQLHNGINTNSKLSNKRQGTVNINASRIDLGGAGVSGAGVIYGDKINVNSGSTIQTHVGATSGDNGKLSANTINISGTNTALKLFVKYADKNAWNDEKGRVYTVLDSDSIGGSNTKGFFGDYTNALFNVEYLRDGMYAICPQGQKYNESTTKCDCIDSTKTNMSGTCVTKVTCGANYTYNEDTNSCSCTKSGYVEVGNQCVLKEICDANEVYDSATNTCSCASGYVSINGTCVAKVTCDPDTEIYNSATNTCSCASGYVSINGTCVAKVTCGENEVYNGTTNTCSCKTGYVNIGGQCVLKASCDANEVYDSATNTCYCPVDAGYIVINGSCQKKPTCTGGQVYNETTNTCVCPSSKPNEYNGQCYAACGENQVFNAGRCDCAPGYERLSDGTCFKKATYTCVGLGCDANEESTFDGWINGPDMPAGTEAAEVQQELFETAQAGQGEELRTALDGLAPDVSPLVQTHATEITRRLSSIVSERFYNSMERTGYVHRGKRFYRFPRKDSNLWVESMYGKSQYDVRKGWDMDTTGLAIGFDGHVSDAVKLGVSYAYTKADGDSVGRETEIDSHTGMVYGSYNPNRYYTNWLAMYTRSQYDEEKRVFAHNVKADYDVDSIAAQVMFGRKMGPYVNNDWATGVIKPEIGARYIYTKQHGYTDSLGQKVDSADGHTLTGILGAQYTIGYTISPTLSWYPELRAALTYDFIEPDTEMRVDLPNQYHYNVKTENMDRFGIEVGARVGLDINRKAEVSLEYEGLFKGDYKNHTGLANLKYKF